MENASKALLIAGAILIAILLIAIGMMVFNSAKGVIDTSASNMSDTEKTAFNKQFDVYNGTQSGSNVKEIISKINTNNSNPNNVKIILGTCTGTDLKQDEKSGQITGMTGGTNAIRNQAQYDVSFSDAAAKAPEGQTAKQDGLLDTVTIVLK